MPLILHEIDQFTSVEIMVSEIRVWTASPSWMGYSDCQPWKGTKGEAEVRRSKRAPPQASQWAAMTPAEWQPHLLRGPHPHICLHHPAPWSRSSDCVHFPLYAIPCLCYPVFAFILLIYLLLLFFYLLLFGCIGSSLLRAGFLWLPRAGATLRCGARASHCSGFSCCGSRALGAQAYLLRGYGIIWDHGLNLCPLPWQADS